MKKRAERRTKAVRAIEESKGGFSLYWLNDEDDEGSGGDEVFDEMSERDNSFLV